MRIGFVSQPFEKPLHDHAFGGVASWTYEVARRLVPEHEVVVYHRVRLGREAPVRAEGVEFRGLAGPGFIRALERVPFAWTPKRPLFASPAYTGVYGLAAATDVRRRRCDVVHVHNFSQYLPLIHALSPRSHLVLHMHCDWLTDLDLRMIAPRLRFADVIIGCADAITDRIRSAFPEVASRCQTVHNGVETTLFGTQPAVPSAGGRVRLMYAGRLSPEKGLHVLMDAFELLLADGVDATLDVVGPEWISPTEFAVDISDDPMVRDLARFYGRSYLAQLRERLTPAAAERVTFVGQVSHPELAERLRGADLFVHPAVWHEPFCMAVVEALCVGVPVVASRTGGLQETVDDGRTGLLVPMDDARGLADAIAALARDPARRAVMSRTAHEEAPRRFSWERVARDVRQQYDRLLGSATERRAVP